MRVVTLIGGVSTGRRIDVGDQSAIYVPYRDADGLFCAELYSVRDWFFGVGPIKLWCKDDMRDDEVLRHLVESLPPRVEGPQWEALGDAMHAMSRLKSSERAKVIDACRHMSEPVPYEGPLCFLIPKESAMTNELEQNDDEVPGGLLGQLPGNDFKIGHIEVDGNEDEEIDSRQDD